MMPKLDGISVLKELKRDESLGFIPVILLTAKADRQDVVAGLDAGADDYLTKPFDQARARRARALHAADQGAARSGAGPGGEARRAGAGTRRIELRARGARRRSRSREIERMSRLKRFLSPQVADVIAASGDAATCSQAIAREVTRAVLRSARLHRLHRDRRA